MLLLCLAVSAVIVMIAIRPRPSYLFNLSVLIFAATGMSAFVIGSRWPALARLRAAIPLAALLLVVLGTPHYGRGYETPQAGQGRPLLQMIERLEPYEDVLSGPGTRLISPQFATEACFYIAPTSPCRGTSAIRAFQATQATASLGGLIKEVGANLVYADELLMPNPTVRQALERLEAKGWRVLGPPPATGQWTLLYLPPAEESAPPRPRASS